LPSILGGNTMMMKLLKDYAQRKPFKSFHLIMQPWDGENLGPPIRLGIDSTVQFVFVHPEVAVAKGNGWSCVIGSKSILGISHDEGGQE
jgi:hypothetical protein